ncbi:MAG: DUF1593 domain-containing protein [Candidatus Hydrogenedentes bacterium]|nr:DUF1593 domain-containing protein [Candidatus Hydrogenedentota bacterium]
MFIAIGVLSSLGTGFALAAELPRVFVSTDIGGSDPDDFQSMVHYLVYADRFETEGLISSPPDKGRAAHLLEAIDAYAVDYENLRTWSADYPAPDALRAVVRQGAIDPQAGETPETLSEGAALLIERARMDDPRPLYVLVWGSITDVAQAVHAAPEIKKSIRVYAIASWNTSQDRKARDYLFNHHPDLWWIESETTFRGMYMGGNQAGEWGNVAFPAEHVAGHGALGALFMAQKRDIKMGDTPSVLYLLHGDPADPEGEHWGGAYVRPMPDERPNYWRDNPDPALQHKDKPGAVTVSRWREDFLSDWRDRMDRVRAKKGAE